MKTPMKTLEGVVIDGIGSALAGRVVPNAEVAAIAGVDPAWIEARTGIRERRFASANESSASLGLIAAQRALMSANTEVDEVDLIVVATCTPDHLFPSTAAIIQNELGARAAAFDMNAACSGFLYGLAIAGGHLSSGMASKALVIGADVLSKFTDPADPITAPLFGDGAGAVVLSKDPAAGPIGVVLGSDGSGGEHLVIPAGGGRAPATLETVDRRQHFIRMAGGEVYRSAVRAMTSVARTLNAESCDLLIGHQANSRILEECASQLGLGSEKVFLNIGHCGNTSAASIPLAMDEARAGSRLKQGDRLVLVAFGAGYTWGGTSLTWTMADPVDERLEPVGAAAGSSK